MIETLKTMLDDCSAKLKAAAADGELDYVHQLVEDLNALSRVLRLLEK